MDRLAQAQGLDLGSALDTKQHQHLRYALQVNGLVQGIGFRPFVYLLAKKLGLGGFIANTTAGVDIEVEGDSQDILKFTQRFYREAPPLTHIDSVVPRSVPVQGSTSFKILSSTMSEVRTPWLLPDLALCPKCRKELFDPSNRRFQYPFINCTHCGPRYSILKRLPYDRPNTTMQRFKMCPDCEEEYHDPYNRRFHAQPIACPQCGPHLEYWDQSGSVKATHGAALDRAVDLVLSGMILALKGLGGYHLIVDGCNSEAITRLRERKHREAKPLALMMPSLTELHRHCRVTEQEKILLQSPAAPIVLLERLSQCGLPKGIAPDTYTLGCMLPYTPLHELLLLRLQRPIIATSGNQSDEPICISEREALERLGAIADGFLTHNRPIAHPVDDSIARVMGGKVTLLRRARGYAPLPLPGQHSMHRMLAVGGHMKNAVALHKGEQILFSPHIGDQDTVLSREAMEKQVVSLCDLQDTRPNILICDKHPDYATSKWAHGRSRHALTVQHHYAHVSSCMAEHQLSGPVLGVAWDGTGYGDDGSVWGGEFFEATLESYTRMGHLRPFMLPGGEQAVKEPWRCALSVVWDSFEGVVPDIPAWRQEPPATEARMEQLCQMLSSQQHGSMCTSAGRFFDAVSALLGPPYVHSFEGHAPMHLEMLAVAARQTAHYDLPVEEGSKGLVLDWRPLIFHVVRDLQEGRTVHSIAAGVHRALAEAIVRVAAQSGLYNVVLSGGCFQNRLLTEYTIAALQKAGFMVYWHEQVPPNDGGLALGQIAHGVAWMNQERA